jgi:hypothetical protein
VALYRLGVLPQPPAPWLTGLGTALKLAGSPIVLGVALIGLTRGRAGLSGLLAALGRFRVPRAWYAVALLGCPAVALAAVLVSGWRSGNAALLPEMFRERTAWGAAQLGLGGASLALFVPILVRYGLVFTLFEEVGRRGFMLPRLLERRSPLPASVAVGVVWMVWLAMLFHLGVILGGFFLPAGIPGASGDYFAFWVSFALAVGLAAATAVVEGRAWWSRSRDQGIGQAPPATLPV